MTENKETKTTAADARHSSPTLGSAFERECQRRYEAERDALNRDHNVITDIVELDGWRITGLSRWKEGVVQYTAFRKTGATAEQVIGYAKDEVFAHLQIPSQNSGVRCHSDGSEKQ